MINEIKNLLAQAWHLAARRKYAILIFVLCVAALTVAIFPHDASWLSSLISTENSSAEDAARFLSLWGDFQTGTLMVVVLLLLGGKFLKKIHWQRVAIACLLAAILAGLTTNVISFATGRPRPYMNIKDGFYGFEKDYTHHSFPSGHSTTAFATATTLSVAYPPIAIPALAAAGAVAWSRLSLNRHYPTDILVGSSIGILFGILLGTAARRIKDGAKPPL